MNSKTIWDLNPDKLELLVDELLELINGHPKKFLINTFFVKDVDQFLGHEDAKEVIIALIDHFYRMTIGDPPSKKIENQIYQSLHDDIQIYIHIDEVVRLGIMTPKKLALYQNLGLIDVEVFPQKQAVGYSWKVMKELVT